MRKLFVTIGIGFLILTCLSHDSFALPIAFIQTELKTIPEKPDTADGFCRRSQLRYWLAKYTSDESEKIKIFETALADSEKVLAKYPQKPVAILRWVAAKSELAQLKSKIVALSYLKPIEAALLKLEKLDPNLESRAADRALGRLYQVAPPIISIGSTEKAQEYFSRAITNAPHHPANQLFYAYFLFDQNKKSEAKQFLQKVLSSPELDKFPLEKDEWLKMAHELLTKIENPA